MGASVSSSAVHPSFSKFCSWPLSQSKDLLLQYRSRDFDFGLDSVLLATLLGGDTALAVGVVKALSSRGGGHAAAASAASGGAGAAGTVINALSFLSAVVLLGQMEEEGGGGGASSACREKAKGVFDCFDFHDSGELTLDETTILLLSCGRAMHVLSEGRADDGRARGAATISEEVMEQFSLAMFKAAGKDPVRQRISKEEFCDWVTDWIGDVAEAGSARGGDDGPLGAVLKRFAAGSLISDKQRKAFEEQARLDAERALEEERVRREAEVLRRLEMEEKARKEAEEKEKARREEERKRKEEEEEAKRRETKKREEEEERERARRKREEEEERERQKEIKRREEEEEERARKSREEEEEKERARAAAEAIARKEKEDIERALKEAEEARVASEELERSMAEAEAEAEARRAEDKKEDEANNVDVAGGFLADALMRAAEEDEGEAAGAADTSFGAEEGGGVVADIGESDQNFSGVSDEEALQLAKAAQRSRQHTVGHSQAQAFAKIGEEELENEELRKAQAMQRGRQHTVTHSSAQGLAIRTAVAPEHVTEELLDEAAEGALEAELKEELPTEGGGEVGGLTTDEV